MHLGASGEGGGSGWGGGRQWGGGEEQLLNGVLGVKFMYL